ncbi:bacillithiol biosynthesis cysteine-adding enzyme BshC [Brevibacillus invocatus]|uniref:Putative cysteine ligase BshC n=1 Tax=Brevibacillus invocatus TaxID=173959 RepID=A0A3M8CK28_9BACL|nr:bacillithiol biosynthesis cysteine-adding enzyme BshC [Brevibacillus invocatus]RNB76060.1 bacillithiol biosynthesis cysteine-adding enzyme BshC [Brevibacillus invocatus]
MNVESVTLPLANRLAKEYLQGKELAQSFFNYQPYRKESYQQRLDWLRSRPYAHREELVEGLYTYNQKMGNHEEALKRIEALKHPDTYVVIGGQQAGVLTGPLYTVHKAIHLIQAAKKWSKELQVEVVPIFWIAGEDHDIDEIDHVYWLTDKERRLHKERMQLNRKGRLSASQMPLDEQAYSTFLQQFFAGQTETVHTQEIRHMLEETASASTTIVEWFARIMAQLFGKHGLVLVESSSPYIRELEQPMFAKVIEKNEQLAAILTQTADRIAQAGYPLQLQVEEHQANLFLYEGGERLLLERYGDRFVNRRCTYTRDELIQLASREPQRFSANVVTRGLMQEHLFPTLAFIGGLGEVAYWAYYKEVFAAFDMQMPIVLPRMSITLLEGAVERLLAGFELNVEHALTDFAAWKTKQETTQARHPLEKNFADVRESMLAMYRPLVDEVVAMDGGLRGLAEKNVSLLLEQVNFLETRLLRSLEEREDVQSHRLKRIEASLMPEGGLQERKLNLFAYANKYGLSLIDRLVEAPFSDDGSHQIFHV